MKTAAIPTTHRKNVGTRCGRCSGFMVPEPLYDWVLGSRLMDWPGWRCVICGELVDPLILLNRRTGPRPRLRSGLHYKGESLTQHHVHKEGTP